MKRFLFVCFALLAGSRAATAVVNNLPDVITIPFERFTLPNGLTLIVHEDHKAPIVAVNIWYHVGSKNERPGKTGFAHLFEHLMFSGSENFNGDYFKAMERIGATDLNGTTSEDRTNYFENVPTSALDYAALAGIRSHGPLLGAIDQETLDRAARRGAERKAPGRKSALRRGRRADRQERPIRPSHPYSWTRHRLDGGPERGLARRCEGVVQDLLRRRPMPSLVAGRRHRRRRRRAKKVEKYFGDIPAGPPVAASRSLDRQDDRRASRRPSQDRVPQARIYKVWNVPAIRHRRADYLDLVADVLARAKTRASTSAWSTTIRSPPMCRLSSIRARSAASSTIIATARPGCRIWPKSKRRSMRNSLAFLDDGPTAEELRSRQDPEPGRVSSAASNASAASAASPTCWP